MTDETDHHRIDESDTISFRSGDGEWHEPTTNRHATGDPELDAVWEMTISELEEILDDESHPLHEKAQQVSAEMMEPVRELIGQIKGGIDTSWVTNQMKEMPRLGLGEGGVPPVPHPAAKQLDPPQARARLTAIASLIDFTTIAPPAATLAEIHNAAEARAHEMHDQQIDVLTELLSEARAGGESGKEALAISRRALEETKSSRRAAWIAAWVAVGALVISIVGIVVTTFW